MEFENHDVSANPELIEEMYQKTGIMTAPVTIIGEEIISGYDEEKMRLLLGI